MEGDLLGLDFGQATIPQQAPQSNQLNVPSFSQFQQDAWQPQPFAGQISPPVAQVAPTATQLAPPPVQLTPPAPQLARLAPPPTQATSSAAQLSPPAAQTAPPAVQIQASSIQYQPKPQGTEQQFPQSYNSPPTAQLHQVSGTSTTSQWSSIPASAYASTIGGQSAANTQNMSTTGTVWNPSPSLDEPQDPVLKQIKEKFGGFWKLVRSDPYDEYLKAAGVGIFARKLAITGFPEQYIAIKGNSIHINFRSTFFTQIHVFKLEESVENVVEKSRQSVFCSYKDGKLTLLMTPLEPGLNRTQEVQRYINEYGELVMIYTCGTATCRRYFARLADLVSPLNIVG